MERKKPLIIAEKPSAARAVAEALGGFRKTAGYLESDQYLLSWALGHLVELWEPEDYDERWRRWSLGSLPIAPPTFRLKVAERTRSQFQVLAQLAHRAAELINACDAGREGELIFRYIVETIGVGHLPARRLWVSALTREAIRKGFHSLRPLGEYDRLYQSALCRARGDWLVGMNATRAFTSRFGQLFSVGRVQTPTLALLVRREREIRAFRPEPYWEVTAAFQPAAPLAAYPGKWFGPDGDRLPSAEAAAAVVQRVREAGQGQVQRRDEKEVAERPPQLFDLTSLQREANRRYGLTAAATLKAAQELYEAKLITYPRTDSRYLTRDLARAAVRPLNALARLPQYQALAEGADLERIWTGRVVNDARVTDHHAIIPTGEAVPALAGAPARIFDLVARRFLAQFYPEARYLEVELVTAVGPDTFRSRGRQVLDEGWRRVEPPPEPGPRGGGGKAGEAASRRGRRGATAAGEGAAGDGSPGGGDEGGADGDEAAALLPGVRPGDPVQVQDVAAVRKETQAPRRYTEAMLLGAMESAGKEMDDESLREAMKGRGLGTPATRAAIIERLKQVGYVSTRGKVLFPTDKGELLVRLAEGVGSQELLSADLTGEWEKRIADIQAGQDDPDRLMVAMRHLAVQIVDQVRTAATPAAKGAGPEGPAEDPLLTATAGVGVRAGTCPQCSGTVTRASREWRCDGCDLRIPGFLCGRSLGAEVAGTLLREQRTQLLTGFVSPRTGKGFSAYLVLRDGKVGFEFPPPRGGQRSRTAPPPRETAKGAKGRAPEAQGGTRRTRTPGTGAPRQPRRRGAGPQ